MNKVLKAVNSSAFREVIYSDLVTPWWDINENSITLYHKDDRILKDEEFIDWAEQFSSITTSFDGFDEYTTILAF